MTSFDLKNSQMTNMSQKLTFTLFAVSNKSPSILFYWIQRNIHDQIKNFFEIFFW